MVIAKKQPSIKQFIDAVPHSGRREDAWVLLDLMAEASGEKPVNWGTCIGYGSYHYRYDSGVEGDAPLVAFTPRMANMVVYIMPGFSKYAGLLSKLGKHRIGKSCLYLGRLDSVDQAVLSQLVRESVEQMRQKYKTKPSVKRGS